MNIAIILPSLKNNAPIQVALDIANYLVNNKCKVDIYILKNIVELPFSGKVTKISLFKEIKFHSYDIIHSHMLFPNIYIWIHRHKIKSVCITTLHNEIEKVLHNSYNYLIGNIFSFLWIKSLSSQNEIICLSNYAKQQLTLNHNLVKSSFIYNGRSVKKTKLDEIEKKEIKEFVKDFKVLGVIAGLSKIKGISQIISTLSILNDYCLLIVGEGQEKSALISQAKELKVFDRCLFIGHQNNAHRYMTYFDIYMMTSYSEGFPLVLIEAAQYKKPTVCSNIAIFNEFFSEKEVVFFDLDDLNSLSNSIKKAYELRNKLSENIYNRYNNCYTSDIMGLNYLNKMNNLMKNIKK